MSIGGYNMESDFVIKQELFVRVRTEPFEKIYQVHPKPIGSGSSAQVLRVRHRQRPQDGWRAAKAYPKNKPHSHNMMLNQLEILRRLDHPAIIKAHEVFENEQFTYVVQEYCEGGELLGRLQEKGGFSELQARRIWRQLLEVVVYCHAQRVCHRDLKPQNVLFLKKVGAQVKVIDFGSAFAWESDMREELLARSNSNVVGTAYYISPDILLHNNHYDQRTDLWSMGVILYILVAGCFPFFGQTEQDVMDQIANYNYSLNIPAMKTASNQVKDLIKRLLVPADQRLTCEQIFAHPWMTSEPNRMPVKVNTAGLAAYSKFSKTKRLAANFLACRATAAEVQQLTRLFQQLDVNRDGELSFEELKQGLVKEGLKVADIKALMDRMDTDHNGKVNYTEFLAGFAGQGQFSEDGIRRAFDLLDRDGNGTVSRQELLQLFQESGLDTLGGRTAEQIMKECDKDGNGLIDYQEFRACLKGKP